MLKQHGIFGRILIKVWPANSSDLNTVDYHIWGKLQEHVYRNRIRKVDQLTSRLSDRRVGTIPAVGH